MKISVIIPVFNESSVINDCLLSLAEQTVKDFEIVVVDDGSTDGTLEKIKNSINQDNNKNLKLIKQDHKGPGAARNLGALQAKGEILVFVDSDMTFAVDFLEKLVAPILQGDALGTFSKEEYVGNSGNVWSIYWGISEGWESGKRHPKNYPDRQKVFRAILKSEFARVGGFSLTGYTDDWTLSDKLGYLAVAAPKAKFYHKNPDNLVEVYRQAKWIGKRQYKLGKLGTLIAIVRSSLPVSLLTGIFKSIVYIKPEFIIFKIVYDFGIFNGALSSFIGGSSAK